MCGIFGYAGKREADTILINGLKCLEYCGYDSCGIAIKGATGATLQVRKYVGRVNQLEGTKLSGTIGIAHTRWATHGVPSIENAHPLIDCTGKIAIVHNGIIENYPDLRRKLRTHTFHSNTDSELFAHLIEEYYAGDLRAALSKAVLEVDGTYAVAVMHQDKEEIVVSRNGSPIVFGLGKDENFVASDVSPIITHTKKVIYMDDLEIGVMTPHSVTVYQNGKHVEKKVHVVDWDILEAQKHGYKHFMLKEINEQPEVVRQSLRMTLEAIPIKKINSIRFVACGTAYHAGLLGTYIMEQCVSIPTQADIASEFRYRGPLIGKGDLVIVISQSGETADTLAALRLAKEKGAYTLGIINVVNSTIAREADQVIYTRAGPEISVASTKAFTSQLVAIYKLAEMLSGKSIKDLAGIPDKMQEVLMHQQEIKAIAKKYSNVHNFIFIARNIQYPIALEGALKLKEISYIPAEGYAGGEMKHGPIALVTEGVPTVALALQGNVYAKMINNIQETKARRGKVICIGTLGDTKLKQHCDDLFFIPESSEMVSPLLSVIALQLLAYYIADLRDCDIDKPRNLAKSVTVE